MPKLFRRRRIPCKLIGKGSRSVQRILRYLAGNDLRCQWGGAHVWKVGGKVFAIGGRADGRRAFTFKTSDLSYEVLKDQPGLLPAPYLASRGMKRIQHFAEPGLSDDALADRLRRSDRIVSLGLPKKRQRELGLNQPC